MGSINFFKAMIARGFLIAIATLLPPWMLMRSAQDAAVIQAIQQRYMESQKTETPAAGDIVWVSGAIQSAALDLTPRLSEFRQDLRLVESIQEWRRSYVAGKANGSWQTIRETEWIAYEASVGKWRLSLDLIRNEAFGKRDVSPCIDYPPAGTTWSGECPEADDADEQSGERRTVYELTPAPRGRVSLIAAVAAHENYLTEIAAEGAFHESLILLATGERTAAEMIAERLNSDWRWMALWWSVTTAVLGVWIMLALRNARKRSTAEIFVGGVWRAIVSTAPLLALFFVFQTSAFIPVAAVATGVTTLVWFCLWFLAGQYR